MKIYKFFYSNKDENEYENECSSEYSSEYELEDEEENENEEDFEKSMENFVKKSKYKFKIIYKNKIYPLKNIFKIIRNRLENLKIKLISYNYILNINEKVDFPLCKYFGFERLKYKKNMNMYKFMDYVLYSSHEIQKLIYKINNKN